MSAMLGGGCIGMSTVWGALLEGRVTGISGELRRATLGVPRSALFVTGLVGGGWALGSASLLPFGVDVLGALAWQRVALASFCVGAGAKLANGCTSGHGVCGLARFSRRSAAAVGTMMTTAMATASVFRTASMIPIPKILDVVRASSWERIAPLLLTAVAAPPLLAAATYFAHKRAWPRIARIAHGAAHVARGFLFATGLMISGMANPVKTLGFLDLRSAWDPSMALVFASAVPPAAIAFTQLQKGFKPFLRDSIELPTRSDIDRRLISGAALFGLGWGLIGMCPGPAITYLGAIPSSRNAQIAVASITGGIFTSQFLLDR